MVLDEPVRVDAVDIGLEQAYSYFLFIIEEELLRYQHSEFILLSGFVALLGKFKHFNVYLDDNIMGLVLTEASIYYYYPKC